MSFPLRSPSTRTNLVLMTLAYALVGLFLVIQLPGASPDLAMDQREGRLLLAEVEETTPCAILFFGLPRAFESLVLPSVRKNVLQTNPSCDIYVHYYNQTLDRPGRSGKGGRIHPDDVHLLDEYASTVYYQAESEKEFIEKRGDLLQKVSTVKDPQDRLLYFPWKERTYNNRTIENIIRMWNSIESAWLLMEREASKRNIQYKRVAMLRNDVVYLTPIYLDEYAADDTAVVPGFGRYPVSDRMVYGPYEAVRVWASERFERIDEHARWILENDEGRALHAETFMNVTIFPAMRKAFGNSLGIVEHPHCCFLRSRADETVWMTDCDYNPSRQDVALSSIGAGIGNIVERLENVLGRRCIGWPYKIDHGFKALNCARNSKSLRGYTADL